VDVRLIRVGVAVGRTFRRLAIGSDRQAASARDPVADGSARTAIAVEWHGGWELTPSLPERIACLACSRRPGSPRLWQCC